MSIFEQASRQKVRFTTPKGNLSVEDLWDLPLTNRSSGACLDDIAIQLYKQLKDANTISFVLESSKADNLTQLKFDLVKHVIDIRKAEATLANQAKEAREKKQKLLAIISQKEDEKLLGSSLEELKAMVDSL